MYDVSINTKSIVYNILGHSWLQVTEILDNKTVNKVEMSTHILKRIR